MRDHLNQPSEPNYLYRFGSAEFDQSLLELRISGQAIDAERRPLELLNLFLDHVGEVLTKDELLNSLWDTDEVGEGALANAVSRLRRLLGPDNASFIVTRPRLGYSFVGKVERIAQNQPLKSAVALESGKPIPGRQDFLLDTLMSVSGNSSREVWDARPVRGGQHHVFKFTAEADGLRQLKREYTISELLSRSASTADSVAHICGRNFETPPFYLEYPFLGPDLLKWSEDKQQLSALSRTERLSLFLQIADTVAAAHSIGVLHKDIKPANILMTETGDGMKPVVTDFGSSHLMQSQVLNDMGISPLGLSITFDASPTSTGGTLLYLAPEVWAGQSPSVQSDVFSLGVMLYQMISGDLRTGIPPDWQKSLDDDLLCEDIQLATASNPAQRIQSVAELAERLRNLKVRRDEAQEKQAREQHAAEMQRALEQSQARRPWLVAATMSLLVGMIASLGLYQEAVRAQKEARRSQQLALEQKARAENINQFWQDEIIQSGNPYSRDEASIRDVLNYASQRINQVFGDDPETAASTHESLAKAFNGLTDYPQARDNYLAAAEKYAQAYGENSIPAWRTRLTLSQLMAQNGDVKDARALLDSFRERSFGDYHTRSLLGFYALKASSLIHSAQQEWTESATDLERAVALFAVLDELTQDDRLSTYLALASKYRRLQRYDEAEELLERILASDTTLSQARMASLKLRQAMIYVERNQLDKAEPLLLKLEEEFASLLGVDSLDSLRTLNQLSRLYSMKGDYRKALGYGRKAYDVSSSQFGPLHANTLIDQSQYGLLLHYSGNSREAIAIMKDAISKFQQMYDTEPAYVHGLRYLIAEALLREKEYEEAERLIAQIDPQRLKSSSPETDADLNLSILRSVIQLHKHPNPEVVSLLQSELSRIEQCDPCIVEELGLAALADAGTGLHNSVVSKSD